MSRSACLFIILMLLSGVAFGHSPDSLQLRFNAQTGTMQIETGIELCNQLTGKPGEMLSLSFSLLEKTSKAQAKPNLTARVFKIVSDAYYYNDSIEQSVEYLNKAITLARTDQYDSVFIAGAYNDLGLNYIELNENTKAFECLGIAVEMFRKLWKPDDLADAMSNLATVYHAMGQFEKAIGLYDEVYQMDISAGNIKSQASSLNNLGRMYVDWKKYETGIEYYKRSLALLDTVADRKITGIRYNNIGVVYQLMGQHGEAIQWIEKALQIDKEENNTLKMAIRQLNLATSYLALNDLKNARHYLELAGNFFSRTGLPSPLTKVYGHLGELYQKQGDLKTAESYFLKAEKMAEQAGTIPEKLIADNYLYRFYKHTGQSGKGLKYFEQFTTNNDSVYKLEAAKHIEELETKYQTEKKENEIQRLETENELRSKELAFRKRERNLAFIGLALLFGFLASLYLLFRRVKSQKTELTTQNNELDRLNKTLNHLFGIISHDLRNAAAAYQSSAKIISHHLENGRPEKLLPLASEIDKNAQQLSALLENLLNWSIIQIKGIHPEKEMVSVKEILDGVVLLFEGPAGIKNNRVILEAKDEKVWCDKESLQLILRNLVGNAVKFTGNGIITLETSTAGEFTEITVSDTGCGMDNATTDNIRNMIFAESRRGTMGEKGAGLGLMLVSEHVLRNGGTLDVESSPGNGTRFIVKLPSTRK